MKFVDLFKRISLRQMCYNCEDESFVNYKNDAYRLSDVKKLSSLVLLWNKKVIFA